MKNIHILPTNKPSKLYIINSTGKLDWSEGYLPQIDDGRNQHIYITSDEEIKGEDWILHNNKIYKVRVNKGLYLTLYEFEHIDVKADVCKKIILTTDLDLIKDGIQAIPSKFLEWFVKNSSCEYVDVKKQGVKTKPNQWGFTMKYFISIPKEESLGFENFEVIKTEEDAKIFVETMENIPEPNDKLKKAFRDFNKQETLEEAIENFLKENQALGYTYEVRYGFIKGAKWQQEQNKNLYSEEDLKKAYKDGGRNEYDFINKYHCKARISFDKWFEQFKKK